MTEVTVAMFLCLFLLCRPSVQLHVPWSSVYRIQWVTSGYYHLQIQRNVFCSFLNSVTLYGIYSKPHCEYITDLTVTL
jgi:hypothetical protein